MQKTILAGTFAIAALMATGAAVQARTVCDESGRCFERRTDVGADIARGVLGNIEGRSAYRDRDYDRGYGRDRGYDRGDFRGRPGPYDGE